MASPIQAGYEIPFLGEIIIDDGDAGFETVGTWYAYGALGYENDFRYSPRGTGDKITRWSVDLLKAGRWQVFACWLAHPAYASDAPYIIHDLGGPTTVRRSQRTSGGQWVSLGIFDFDVGTALVELSNDANSYVIADAIRFVYVGP